MNSYEALSRLVKGNERFVRGDIGNLSSSAMNRPVMVDGQSPFAVILGCSDSRVPVEIVFDQGLGDLFIVRVAGNIVAPSQIGSVEFAVERFGTPLVVVLGHSHCGAIDATLNFDENGRTLSPNLSFIVERIRPGISEVMKMRDCSDAERTARAVRANVQASVEHLKHGSQAMEQFISDGKLLIVGAEYSLQTGQVEFHHGVDE